MFQIPSCSQSMSSEISDQNLGNVAQVDDQSYLITSRDGGDPTIDVKGFIPIVVVRRNRSFCLTRIGNTLSMTSYRHLSR